MVDSMKMSSVKVQLSKKRYVVPGVVFLISINTYFCYMYGICKSLYSHYGSNIGGHQKLWLGEGMLSESLTLSMQFTDMVKTSLNAMWIDVIIRKIFCFLMIMLIENRWTVNEYKLEYLFELGALGFYGFETLSLALSKLRTSESMLPVLLACGILFGVYYLTKKRLLVPEMLFYFPLILSILADASLYFFMKNPIPTNFSHSIENYKQISPTLRRRMINLCRKYDIDTNNVFISPDKTLNAGSIRLFQFKLILMHSALVDAFTEDQTMAILCHEIKHILSFDSMKRQIKITVESALRLAYAFSLYRTITPRCSGLVAAFIYYNSSFAINPLFDGVYNFFLGHNEELNCDNHSISEGLRKPMEEGLKLLALSHEGMFFDFNTPWSLLDEHPSIYNRVKAIRQR